MDHPTTYWAQQLGLPDPGVDADAILAARPDELRSLAVRNQTLVGTLRGGSDQAEQAAAALRLGWSAPAPLLALRGLAGTGHVAAGICLQNAATLRDCADLLAQTQVLVRQAYADADAAIAAQGLLSFSAVAFASGWAPQRTIVTMLHARTHSAAILADAATARLIAGLGPDPRPPAPVRTLATPVTQSGSAAIDAHYRAILAADLVSGSPFRRAFAERVDLALRHAADATGTAVQLLDYDPDHPPRQGAAAVALGDVSTADQVAVLVPGVGNSPSDMSGALDSAAALAAAATAVAPTTATATVLWLGYDVPASFPGDVMPTTTEQRLADATLALNAFDATVGGAALAQFCAGLRTTMGPSTGLTLVGHSYGSTVVSQAALRLGRDAGVDDIVLLASPGSGYGVHDAGGYRAVAAAHVYALAFPGDPVPNPATDALAAIVVPFSGLASTLAGGDGSPFGPDPAAPEYGAQVIDAPSGIALDGIGAADLVAQHSMDNYLSGAALTAVAGVVVGAYGRVPVRRHR